ncbi:MAG: hypothetical protein R2794_09290 [Chitinophagales bacterium]
MKVKILPIGLLILCAFSACTTEKKYVQQGVFNQMSPEQVYETVGKEEKQATGLLQSIADAPEQQVTFSALSLPEYPLLSLKTDTSKTDTTEIKPVIQPMVLTGTGTVVLGTAAAAIGFLSAPVLIPLAAILLLGSCFLTGWGWRKIKEDPKKYKGEKLAAANYLIVGLVGVAASFYFLYLLFSV